MEQFSIKFHSLMGGCRSGNRTATFAVQTSLYRSDRTVFLVWIFIRSLRRDQQANVNKLENTNIFRFHVLLLVTFIIMHCTKFSRLIMLETSFHLIAIVGVAVQGCRQLKTCFSLTTHPNTPYVCKTSL